MLNREQNPLIRETEEYFTSQLVSRNLIGLDHAIPVFQILWRSVVFNFLVLMLFYASGRSLSLLGQFVLDLMNFDPPVKNLIIAINIFNFDLLMNWNPLLNLFHLYYMIFF